MEQLRGGGYVSFITVLQIGMQITLFRALLGSNTADL